LEWVDYKWQREDPLAEQARNKLHRLIQNAVSRNVLSVLSIADFPEGVSEKISHNTLERAPFTADYKALDNISNIPVEQQSV
jgi:hypothetical protein